MSYLRDRLSPPLESVREEETKVCTLEHLILWLETMPADKTYCWWGSCLFEQYGQRYTPGATPARSYNNAIEGFFRSYPNKPLGAAEPCGIASAEPRTFGAALIRARAALASRS